MLLPACDVPDAMLAMVLDRPGTPLVPRQVPVPRPGPRQVLLRVEACGVCRTDLHIVDGELASSRLPLVPGHEIVGVVAAAGAEAIFSLGERLGVPWLASTCGSCRFCRSGRENLCGRALYTGYTVDGGYAQYAVADGRYVFRLPPADEAASLAPLLCAGLIGYRTYRLAGEAVEHLGIYGFGAAAHIIAQVAVHQGKKVYAFTRPGDHAAQAFAGRLGCVWAGGSDTLPPHRLDAALIFAPVGNLVVAALAATDKGGTVVCGGIHMSDIPSFPYSLLWEERSLRSVANLTRRDGLELLALAPEVPVRTEVTTFPLVQANEALARLREGRIDGAVVLLPSAG